MKINIDLNDPHSIDKAIKSIKEFAEKMDVFRKEYVAEMTRQGADIANAWFAQAIYPGTNDANVKFLFTQEGYRGVVYAEGRSVLFIEFGTGILKADNSRERDELIRNAALVKQHGEYGPRAKNPKGWIYRGEIGNAPPDTREATKMEMHNGFPLAVPMPGFVRTYGNKANSSMWYARMELEDKYSEIAKAVWDRVMP